MAVLIPRESDSNIDAESDTTPHTYKVLQLIINAEAVISFAEIDSAANVEEVIFLLSFKCNAR